MLVGINEGLFVKAGLPHGSVEVHGVFFCGHHSLLEGVELGSSGECVVWFSKHVFKSDEELCKGGIRVQYGWI